MNRREIKMKKVFIAPIDGRKSFYKKAVSIEDNGVFTLYSYGTLVAKIEDGVCERFMPCPGANSMTTRRHIRAFCAHYGVDCPDLGKMK